MRRSLVALALALVVTAAPAQAKLVDLTASPNLAALGTHVRHTVSLGAPAGSSGGFGVLPIWGRGQVAWDVPVHGEHQHR